MSAAQYLAFYEAVKEDARLKEKLKAIPNVDCAGVLAQATHNRVL
jgi:hypothetical protein